MNRAHRIAATLALAAGLAATLAPAVARSVSGAGPTGLAPEASRPEVPNASSPEVASAPPVGLMAASHSAFSIQTWRSDEGLPNDMVNDLAQDREGYLWVATNAGLARFDGIRFRIHDHQNTPQLGSDDCTRLLLTRAGALWIGTVGGGLTRLEGGRFTGYGKKDGIEFQYPTSFFEDDEGRLWVGTNQSAYVQTPGGFARLRGEIDRLTWPLPFYEESPGRIWLRGSEGYAVWDHGQTRFVGREPSIAPPGSRWPTRLFTGRDGAVWSFETDTHRFIRKQGDRITVARNAHPEPGERYGPLVEDRDGTLWLGTPDRGLRYLEDGVFHSIGEAEGLPGKTVTAIKQDREGSIWVATNGGLCRLRRRAFSMIGHDEGLPDERVWTALEDRSGDLWIGTESGLVRRHGTDTTLYTVRNGLPGPGVVSLLEDGRGRLWIGTNGGLAVLEDGRLRAYTEKDGLSHKSVRALFEDRRGRLWIGTAGGGANILENGRLSVLCAKDGLGSDWIRFIQEDREGNIWLCTTGGLTRWREGAIRTWTKADGLSEDILLSVHEDADGSLWIATLGGGICRMKDGRFRAITTKDGLPDNTILRILEGQPGDLWMSTPRGIFRLERRELHELADGARADLTSVAYGKRDGLATTDCGGGTQPAGCRGRDGRLYFPTSRGLAVVDPARLATNRVVPPVVIEEALSDGQSAQGPGGIVLPPGARRLEIRYTALSLSAPEKVRFRYRLEGFDPGWVDAGTRRVATYTALPPRAYRFRVLAANDDGLWNEEGALIAVRARPYFYQTWAFLSGCILLTGAGIWALYRLRMRQIEARFAAVLEERGRIARELHDTIASGFTGVSMQLEALTARLPELPREARESLDRARLLIRSSLADARRSVRAMRPRALETGDLSSSLRAMVDEATSGTTVRGTFSSRGMGRSLPPLVEDHLLRIGQEALSNALKHGECREVTVVLSYQRRRVELAVTDDGRGIDESRAVNGAPGGMGLAGMRERLAQVGGRLDVTSRPGAGTTVRAVAPLPGIALWRS